MYEGNKVTGEIMAMAKGLLDGTCEVGKYLDALELMTYAIEKSGKKYTGMTDDSWADASWLMMLVLCLERGGHETSDLLLATKLENIPQAAADGGFLAMWDAYETGVSMEDIMA